jgi:hypothetical protein
MTLQRGPETGGGLRCGPDRCRSDQTSADADQTASDADRRLGRGPASADSDQRASDRDQATADRDHAADPVRSAAGNAAYNASRTERAATCVRAVREPANAFPDARDHDETATRRDQIAAARDEAERARDARVTTWPTLHQPAAAAKLWRSSARPRAAADRARAAEDRQGQRRISADAAQERTLSRRHCGQPTSTS